MSAVVLVIRLGLAAVFAFAGLAKLCDLPGSRRALNQFGVPEALARPGGVALPLVELAIAGALLPASSARWGAAGALVLLCAFAVAIARALVSGRHPDCHCFGRVHSEPAGVGTLSRDAVLAAAAAFVVIAAGTHPGPGALSWIGRLPDYGVVALAVGLALAAVIVGLVWFCFQLLRQNGRLLERIEAVERRLGVVAPAEPVDRRASMVGSRAPSFALPDLGGRVRSLDELRGDLPSLLIFTDPACGPCGALMPEIALWQREYGDRIAVVVIARGDPDAVHASAEEHGLVAVLVEDGREVSDGFEAIATPSAVVVSEMGLIESRPMAGAKAIRGAFADALMAREPRALAQGPPVGAPAPDFELPDLDGRVMRRGALRGTDSVLVFWHPYCGHCQRILSELKARGPSDRDLVLISAGPVEAILEQGLDCPILLDDDFDTGTRYGVTGTPSAIVIDVDGLIASPLAVGGPAVVDLVTGPAPVTLT